MRLWKSILSLCLLVLWLPATAHCDLEAIGLFPLDECCETTGDHRSDTACKVVEDSSFKTECAATLPEPPESIILVVELSLRSISFESHDSEITEAPFETHHLPQFVIQTAIPIRGPSLAS